MRILFGLVACLVFSFVGSSSALASWVYDANATMKADQMGTNTNSTFGRFTAGYGSTNGAVGSFLGGFQGFATGLGTGSHTDKWLGNTNLRGWNFANKESVPSVVVNTSSSGVAPGSGISTIGSGQIVMHGGGIIGSAINPPIFNAVLRFTAEYTGIHSVNGSWDSLASGSTRNLVLVNNVIQVDSTANSSLFSFSTFLNVGGTIDFVVNNHSDGINDDSTGLTASITAVPEPTTLALFGLGGVGLAIAKRRRTRKVAS
jgi:hypothetical protein